MEQQMKKKGEITIDEESCLACGYCVEFCPKDCIILSGEKYNSLGFHLPVFSNPDECIACGVCALLCPQYCIEVYQLINSQETEEKS